MIPEDSRVEIDAKIHAGYCEFHLTAKTVHRLMANSYDRKGHHLGGVGERSWAHLGVC